MATILILDEDLGFVFWLGQALTAASFKPLPAQNVSDAKRWLRRFKLIVDVLILDPAVPGAIEFAEWLRCQQGQLRVVAAVGERPEPSVVAKDVDALRKKPEVLDPAAEAQWLQVIRSVLAGNANTQGGKATAGDGH